MNTAEETSIIQCPGCSLKLPNKAAVVDERFNASGECRQLYGELSGYTLSINNINFIHQHAADTYAAQHSGEKTRTITTAFALIGLYLALEKGYTGKQVQQAHMKLAKISKSWPRLEPPKQTGVLTVLDVLQAKTDVEKEEMLMKWANSI